jgi:hypothetical protein
MTISGHRPRRGKSSPIEAVAGNGLLDRRALLGRGVILAGAIGTAPLGFLDRRRRGAPGGRTAGGRTADRCAVEPRARRCHRAL